MRRLWPPTGLAPGGGHCYSPALEFGIEADPPAVPCLPGEAFVRAVRGWIERTVVAAGLVAGGAIAIAQQPSPPAQRPAAPSFPQLTPQQQAALEQLLAAWETRNASVRTWSCGFHKWEYNAWSPTNAGEQLAFAESSGEIKYAAPDKGLFRVKASKQWNPETRRYEVRTGEVGEHWVCNGTSIYEFRHTERQLRETKLPPEMQGKAISDGPLPFVFAQGRDAQETLRDADHHATGGDRPGVARGAAAVSGRRRQLLKSGADSPGPRSDAIRDPDLQAGRAGSRCLPV